MAPAFKQAAAQLQGQALLVKVNSDDNPQLSQRFGIRSIPTLVRLQRGVESQRQSGALPAAAIVAMAIRTAAQAPPSGARGIACRPCPTP